MTVYKNMTREYKLGVGRVLMAKKSEDVYNNVISEMASEFRGVSFPLFRWSTFTRALGEIGNEASELQTNPKLKYVYHIGGAFYVLVTVGLFVRRYQVSSRSE